MGKTCPGGRSRGRAAQVGCRSYSLGRESVERRSRHDAPSSAYTLGTHPAGAQRR